MTVVIAFVSIATFIIILWLLHIVQLGAKAISISQGALTIMQNERLGDADREKAVQQSSIMLFKIFFSIFYRSILVVTASLMPIIVADWLGWVKSEEVTAFLFRVDVISITSILLVIIYFVGKALWPSK